MGLVAGRDVFTLEGLSPDGDHPAQRAWKTVSVSQYGYCQPGQMMQAPALLREEPKPIDDATTFGFSVRRTSRSERSW